VANSSRSDIDYSDWLIEVFTQWVYSHLVHVISCAFNVVVFCLQPKRFKL